MAKATSNAAGRWLGRFRSAVRTDLTGAFASGASAPLSLFRKDSPVEIKFSQSGWAGVCTLCDLGGSAASAAVDAASSCAAWPADGPRHLIDRLHEAFEPGAAQEDLALAPVENSASIDC